MVIIGERLNSSRAQVYKALAQRDEAYLIEEAQKQKAAGAGYIDLNTAALLDEEIQTLKWAIPLLQNKLTISLSIDTPNHKAIEEGLSLHKGQALLNSLTGEKERINNLLPLIKKYRPGVVVLCLDDEGIPNNPKKKLSIAQRMVEFLKKEGVSPEDIFIDPLVHSIGVDQDAANLFLDSLRIIKKNLPGIKTIAGISNISFGLPRRRLLNRTFLVLALHNGLDAAIIDPLDRQLISCIHSTQALLGKDPFLKRYLSFIRSNVS